MMGFVEIKDAQSTFRLGPPDGEYLNVKLEHPDAKVKAKPYLYTDHADLIAFFDEMAKDWKGWSGIRVWSTVESDFELTATNDGVSTVTLKVMLNKADSSAGPWSFTVDLKIDLGDLNRIADELRALF